MSDNNTILLINLNYDDNDNDHILYEIPVDQLELARQAVNDGCTNWSNSGPNEHRTIEDFVNEALKKAGIQFKPLEYQTEEIYC